MSIFGPQNDNDDLLVTDPLDDVDVGQTSAASISDLDTSAEEDERSSEDFEQGQPLNARERTKWKRLTADDRRIAQALDAVDDRDLSIHLYNTHALKARAQRPRRELGRTRDWQSKSRWRDGQTWVPNQGWTAWPLDESSLLQANTDTAWEKLARHHPYAELQECVMARMLRFARKQLPPESNSILQAGVAKRKSSSTAGHMSSEVDSSDGQSESEDCFIALADDDEARSLLQPAIRRIMASVDSSLLSLHRARQNRYGGMPDSRTSLSRSTSVASSTHRSQSTGRASRSVSTGHGRSASIGRRREKPVRAAARDWSEVLGFALQSGWSDSAVSRAAARCSQLFGESMNFCTFTAASLQHSLDSTSRSRPQMLAHDSGQDVKLNTRAETSSTSRSNHRDQEQPGSNASGAAVESTAVTNLPASRTSLEDRAVNGYSTPIMLSDNTHQDGFLQPIVASRNW